MNKEGRPLLGKEKRKIIAITIDVDLNKRLCVESTRRSLTKSQYINEILATLFAAIKD